MSSIFPVELTDMVIDNLHDDVPTLSICAVVCRSWCRRSRPHIFRRLYYTADINYEELYRFFCDNPDIATYVRVFCFSNRRGERWSPALTTYDNDIIKKIACVLPSLETLSIRHCSIPYIHHCGSDMHIPPPEDDDSSLEDEEGCGPGVLSESEDNDDYDDDDDDNSNESDVNHDGDYDDDHSRRGDNDNDNDDDKNDSDNDGNKNDDSASNDNGDNDGDENCLDKAEVAEDPYALWSTSVTTLELVYSFVRDERALLHFFNRFPSLEHIKLRRLRRENRHRVPRTMPASRLLQLKSFSTWRTERYSLPLHLFKHMCSVRPIRTLRILEFGAMATINRIGEIFRSEVGKYLEHVNIQVLLLPDNFWFEVDDADRYNDEVKETMWGGLHLYECNALISLTITLCLNITGSVARNWDWASVCAILEQLRSPVLEVITITGTFTDRLDQFLTHLRTANWNEMAFYMFRLPQLKEVAFKFVTGHQQLLVEIEYIIRRALATFADKLTFEFIVDDVHAVPAAWVPVYNRHMVQQIIEPESDWY